MNVYPLTPKNGATGTKRKPLPTTCFDCRDCGRKIGWCKDVKDLRGARCWDCAMKYRRKGK